MIVQGLKILFIVFCVTRSQTLDDTTINILPQICGKPAVKPIPSQLRIVGGIEALPHSWPWQISLQKNVSGNFTHWCGGTIISPSVILSAAHCFVLTRLEKLVKEQYRVVAGAHDLTDLKDRSIQIRAIKKIYLDPLYNPFKEPRPNDVSLIILQEPLTFNSNISAACLPRENISRGEDCYAVGWGNTKGTGISTLLNQARIPIYDLKTCETFPDYENVIGSMLCSWNPGAGLSICSGDSGSSYSCLDDDGLWYLQGVTVYSSCTGDRPIILQRVFSHLQWIKDTTGLNIYIPETSKTSILFGSIYIIILIRLSFILI